MKRIYIRAGMSPFESFPAHKMLLNNSIGQNLGNFFIRLRYFTQYC